MLLLSVDVCLKRHTMVVVIRSRPSIVVVIVRHGRWLSWSSVVVVLVGGGGLNFTPKNDDKCGKVIAEPKVIAWIGEFG